MWDSLSGFQYWHLIIEAVKIDFSRQNKPNGLFPLCQEVKIKNDSLLFM